MSEEKKPVFSFKTLTEKNLKAWEEVLTRVLSHRSRTYEVKKTEDLRHLQNSCTAFEHFDYHYGFLSKEEALVGRFTKSQDDIAKVADLLHDIYENVEDPKLCELTVAEVLTKVLAYRNLLAGTEIDIPTRVGSKIEMRTFKVDKVFDLWHQMKAFGLRPVDRDEAPLLLFRGTDFTLTSDESRASVACNFDPSGPGRTIYLGAREAIRAWLKRATQNQSKARAYGYSLGGAFAAYALIDDHQFFSKKVNQTSYLFNHPGVDEKLQHKWENLSDKPLFEAYVSKGDPVSKYGILVGDTYQLSIEERLAPIRSHVTLFFTQPEFSIAPVDLNEENSSQSRHTYTKLHAKTSNLFYKVALKHFFPHLIREGGEEETSILWS
ncbi:MAG: hypothetical protein MRY21_08530 [Simkaniaceae bacterium]|nr:hypothetical protein [Simkaniaceae bacterium]